MALATTRSNHPGEATGPGGSGTGVLRTIGLLSFFDRFSTAPLLVLAVRDLHVPMATAVQLVTVYALSCALGQPVWGVVSDRIGRKAVLIAALAGMIAGSGASVLAPTFTGLLVARTVTGLFVGALFPTALTILGDRYVGTERSRQISDLQTFTALGTTGATLLAGTIAIALGWRLVFALAGIAAIVLVVLAARLADPAAPVAVRAFRQSFTRWPLALYGVGVLEGGLLLGMFTYVLPALERDGVSVSLAGVLASAYGVGIVVGAVTSKRIAHRIDRTTSIGTGSALLVAAFLVASLHHTPAGLTVTAALLGLCNSLLHASLQGLATELTPASRATTVSFFVCSVFVGSSLATALTAAQTTHGYGTVFGEAAGAGVLMAAAAVAVSRGWSRRAGTTPRP
ncbi:MFS transporter [Kineococcus sp. GCM10028916]|uniref:MFS transporter n=1 Tax=Kineococcus sp. GCM10028916 TaxID=3273394 RepID=UPI003638EEAF